MHCGLVLHQKLLQCNILKLWLGFYFTKSTVEVHLLPPSLGMIFDNSKIIHCYQPFFMGKETENLDKEKKYAWESCLNSTQHGKSKLEFKMCFDSSYPADQETSNSCHYKGYCNLKSPYNCLFDSRIYFHKVAIIQNSDNVNILHLSLSEFKGRNNV